MLRALGVGCGRETERERDDLHHLRERPQESRRDLHQREHNQQRQLPVEAYVRRAPPIRHSSLPDEEGGRTRPSLREGRPGAAHLAEDAFGVLERLTASSACCAGLGLRPRKASCCAGRLTRPEWPRLDEVRRTSERSGGPRPPRRGGRRPPRRGGGVPPVSTSAPDCCQRQVARVSSASCQRRGADVRCPFSGWRCASESRCRGRLWGRSWSRPGPLSPPLPLPERPPHAPPGGEKTQASSAR